MEDRICEKCKECWNYRVSEIGCFGSYEPCEHLQVDVDPEEGGDANDSTYEQGIRFPF